VTSVARSLLAVLNEAADAVAAALSLIDDWGPSGTRVDQYLSDLVADEAALAVLDRAGLGALSEESGVSWGDRDVVVVLDPLDGSTNASRGVPWFATSLCAIDSSGPIAAVVVNLADGTRYDAVAGEGARRDGVLIRPSTCERVDESILGLSGYPPRRFGWKQYRCLGAAALDLCAVASGVLDGFVDCAPDAHAPWDYLGGVLVCREAGAIVADAFDRELVMTDYAARRTPVAAGTGALMAALLSARLDFA
jgi:fructose-1,6-bisphosphatase/inositol monophosphatase family enzyme